jgi:hypothetical protein
MAIQIVGGVSGSVAEVGVGASIPLHTVIKPLPYGALGHYRVARRLVPAGTTTAGNLWTLRNPTASGILVVVKRVLLKVVQNAAPTAAVEDIFTLKVARAYTVADTTNSAAISPASAMQKMRTSMGNAAAQVRESNAAGGASGGTKTVDTDAIATGSVWVAAALASGQGTARRRFSTTTRTCPTVSIPWCSPPTRGFCSRTRTRSVRHRGSRCTPRFTGPKSRRTKRGGVDP